MTAMLTWALLFASIVWHALKVCHCCTSPAPTPAPTVDWTGPTVDMLNAMQQLMDGGAEYFDPAFMNELRHCWDQADPQLRSASDRAWQGLIDYFDNDGYGVDAWGSLRGPWLEYNPTAQDYNNILIHEPCNYASSISYYHVATEICHNKDKFTISGASYVAMVKSFSFFAFTSAATHGSNTRMFLSLDNLMYGIMAYTMHQASVDNLRELGASSIITDLMHTPRPLSGIEMANNISDIFLNKPVNQWESEFPSIDSPDYYLVFAAILTSTMTLAMEPWAVDLLIPVLMDFFSLEQVNRDFILNDYLPEYRSLIGSFAMEWHQKLRIKEFQTAALKKLKYAFLWSEIVQLPFLSDPLANLVGGGLLPDVNLAANMFNSQYEYPGGYLQYHEKSFQRAAKVYPGDHGCNRQLPRPKWHIESAVAFLDLAFLCEQMNNLLAELIP